MPLPSNEDDFAEVDGLVNRFDGLAVFEPSKEFLDAPDVIRPVNSQNDPITYAAETTASFEDAFIAMLFFIDDLNDLRAHIALVWHRYKETGADPVPAAVATNTAIEFVREMVDETLPMMSSHGGILDVLEQCYMYCCSEDDHDDATIAASLNDQFNETYHIANETFMVVSHLLSDLNREARPGRMPLYDNDKYGSVDHTLDRSKKTGKEKFKDDEALLTPYTSDLLAIVVGPIPFWPVHDEFLNGVERMLETGEVSFSMVFATQIFLDVTYILGTQITQPCCTMQKHVDLMRNDLNKHPEHHDKFRSKSCAGFNEEKLFMLERGMYAMRKDPIALVYGKAATGRMTPVPGYEHRIFRMAPIMSGLALYHFRIRYRDAGIKVDNFWSAIQCCEHLYNALNSYEQLSEWWTDMDLVKSLLGPDSFYVGGQEPQTSMEQFRKFGVQMGISVASMTPRRRQGPTVLSKGGARGLKVTAPVSTMFSTRYARNTEIPLTLEERATGIVLSSEQVQGIIDTAVQKYKDERSSSVQGDDSEPQQETKESEKGKEKQKQNEKKKEEEEKEEEKKEEEKKEEEKKEEEKKEEEKKEEEKKKKKEENEEEEEEKKKEKGKKKSRGQLKSKSKTTKNSAEKKKLSLGATTDILALVMTQEAAELAFPYLLFHRWCWRLLRAVRKEVDPQLKAVFGPDYISDEAELPQQVGFILNLAAGADGGPQRLGPLCAAGKAVDAMLRSGMGSCILDATFRKTLGMDVEFE